MKLLRGLLLKPTLNLLSRILRQRNGKSLIIGGPLGWSWVANLDTTHHGALAGPANAHRHSDLADIGIDNHHARDHATRHQNGGADEISVAGLSGLLADDQHVLDAEVLAVAAALVHAARHQNGGTDEISVAGLSGLLADDQHVLDAEVLAVAAALVHVHDAAAITTGTFPVARGGTGLSTIALGGILYASALDVLSRLAPTAANQVLRSTAANALQFATLLAADIPNLDAAKITSGTFALARIPNMDWAHISGLFPRTIADILSNHNLANHPLAIIPVMDDGHIPDLETLSYGAAFAVAQIPGLPASQIISGQFPLSRMPRAASGLFLEGNGATDPIYNALVAANIPNLDAAKITTGVLLLARIPNMDWAHISGLFPRTIADLLSNHNLANHPLAIIPNMDWAHISGLFPRTIADLLSNHDKAIHDALNIDADTVDGKQPGTAIGDIAYYNGLRRVYDSDRLDGYHETSFGRLAAARTWTATQTFSAATPIKTNKITERTAAAGVDIDNCLIKDGKAEDSNKLEGSTKAQVQDHTPKAHTLASHSTKAHTELTGVTTSQHHTKYAHPTTGACPQTPKAHESTHVAGGADDIDSALAIAAMANLTNNKMWKGNASNRPVEVAAPAGGPTIATGSYTGNDTDDRQITTGFKCSAVICFSHDGGYCRIVIPNITIHVHSTGVETDCLLHATDGFVVDTDVMNHSSIGVYYYWAISE